MKTKLLLLAFLGTFAANAQTTHNLDWYMGIGTNVDLTIDQGDTVIWTWGDEMPHTVENDPGNSVETFNRGTITGQGSTFSHTFTVVGANDYFCLFHSATMAGTITVEEVLGVEENELNTFGVYPNPANETVQMDVPKNIETGQILVFDVLGKQIYSEAFDSNDNFSINVSNWSPGIYSIQLVSGKTAQTVRFIKN